MPVHPARFERILKDTPALEKRLLEMTLDELDAARDWMLLLGRKTAQEKIATFLTILARRAAALEMKSAPRRARLRSAADPRGDRRLSGPDHRDRQPPDHRAAQGPA